MAGVKRPSFSSDKKGDYSLNYLGKWVDEEALAEWRALSDGRYQWQPGEYSPPARDLVVVDHATAFTVDIEDPRDFCDRPALWRAVRGSYLALASSWPYPVGKTQEVLVELIPAPGNVYEFTAVSVDLDGIQLGYLNASYARVVHWRIRQLNTMGYRVLTAALYRPYIDTQIGLVTTEAFAAVPTLQTLDAYLPDFDEVVKSMRPLWDAIDEPLRQQIVEDRYHLSEDTAIRLCEYAGVVPHIALPTVPSAASMPRYFDYFLRGIRSEDGDRLVKEAIREWEKQRAEIVQVYLRGWSQSAVAEFLGIPKSRVFKALVESGFDTRDARKSRVPNKRR